MLAQASPSSATAWPPPPSQLLRSSLGVRTHIPFDALKRRVDVVSFDPGVLGQVASLPVWEDFEPPRPGTLSGLGGGKARYERERTAAWQRFQQALAEQELAEEIRRHRLAEAQRRSEVAVSGTCATDPHSSRWGGRG